MMCYIFIQAQEHAMCKPQMATILQQTNKMTAPSVEPIIKMKKLMMYHTYFIKKIILIMSK